MENNILCDKISRGIHHPYVPGYDKINASSNGPRQWKGLSPFLLGPFIVTDPIENNIIYPGYQKINENDQQAIVKKFENYWQGSKIFNIDVVNNIIQQSFFDRRAKMYSLDKGKRRAIPKAKGYPIAGYYNGVVMDYITSRKLIYCPIYEFLVRRTVEYKNLYNLVINGTKILIVGPDGRNIPITKESLIQAVNDPNHIFGHELVLCSLLKGYKPWDNEDDMMGIPYLPTN